MAETAPVQEVEMFPGEELPLVANFQDELASGETVASATATAVDSAGNPAPGAFLGTRTVASPRVQQNIVYQASLLGESVRVTVTATTSAGLDYTQRWLVKVQDLNVLAPALVTVGVDANTYVTLAEADAYFLRRLRSDAWDAASRRDKQKALISATRDLDALRYREEKDEIAFDDGQPTKPVQPLAFPRTYTLDGNGAAYVPQEVKDAQCEQALALLAGGSGADRRRQLQAQGVTSFSVEGMSESYGSGRTAAASHPWSRLCPDAQRLLARHVEWGVALTRA
jgi:hypothetical protein